jgi:hypothetical protein
MARQRSGAMDERTQAFLERLRSVDGLVERSPGTFHFRSKAFFHFHGFDDGRVADVKLHGEWVRRPAETARELAVLGKEIEAYVSANRPARRRPG